MKKEIQQAVKAIVPEITRLRRTIHKHPEPAYEEKETAKTIIKQLESIDNITIEKHVGGTGVVAHLNANNPGPCVALRADMDCLRMQEQNSFAHASASTGLMHGCGHDGHIACLVGAAKVLGMFQEKLAGPVKFIFQPAEENYGGAKKVVNSEIFAAPLPEAIFGLHGTPSLPLGYIGLRHGAMMAASRYFVIRVKGRGTHAAMPHKGVDTVLAASQIVCNAHTIVSRNINPLEAALISIPKFNGSTAPNVMPTEVVMEGTLRALSNETRDYLEARLTAVVAGVADSFGAEADIVFDRGYPLLFNEKKSTEYLIRIAKMLVTDGNLMTDYPVSLGSEDFSFYLERVPGAFFWLGLGVDEKNDAPLHNPRFDFNDDALSLGISMHCHIALDFHTF